MLIVEDIVDSGLTLYYLLRNLRARNPRSLEVCALLTKPERRKVELDPPVRGLRDPDKFAIGYGLDLPSATAISRTWRRSAPGHA